MRSTLFNVFFLLCSTYSGLVVGQDSTLVIQHQEEVYKLNSKAWVLKDNTGKIKFDSVKKSNAFRPLGAGLYYLSQDSNVKAYWLRVKIDNQLGEDLDCQFYFLTGLDSVTLYRTNNSGQPETSFTGVLIPTPRRVTYLSQELTLPVIIDQGINEFYFEIRNSSAWSKQRGAILLNLAEERSFINYFLEYRHYHGIALGMLVSMLAFILFIYLFFRDYTYLIFLLNITLTTCFLVSMKHYHEEIEWLGRALPYIRYWHDPIGILLIVTAILFVQNFLDTKVNDKMMHSIMNALMIALLPIFLCVVTLNFLNLMNLLSLVMGIVASIVVVVSAVRSLRKGNKLSLYILVGYLFVFFVPLMYILQFMGRFPFRSVASDFHYFGEAFRTVIFAAGIADRFYGLKKEVLKQQLDKQMLKELDSLKTKFFSNITHEFRTPLTLIQGPATELYEREKNPEAKHLLSLIRNNSDRLLKLINQLLDLAKLDSHEMKLNLAPVRLNGLVNLSALPFASLASSRGIKYHLNINEELPVVMADAEKMEVMFSNLISNAIKFTSNGGRVQVNALWENNTFIVRVSDTGRGIPPEKLEHIFDRFYQVNPTDASHSEGTGIGLSLVKEYTELMTGIIEVESKIGHGTTFNIKLPLQPCADVFLAPPSLSKTEPDRKKEIEGASIKNINGQQPLLLLVEDHDEIRHFIKTCLGNQYRYQEARHGKEGLIIAHHEVPDIIISDWMMPEMDGVELCRQLKKDPRTNHIPFIMLTAKADQQHKLEGLQTGADDYLIKPFNKEELVLKVQNLVTLRDKLQLHLRAILLATSTPIEATSANEKFIIKAKTFVEAHLSDETLSVETLAAEMSLSREQCYRKITALSGLSPSAFIRKLRLQKAAQLLAAKADTVSQIAYETGFGNLSHFSKAFKEEFGELPSEFGQLKG
jgi:signal transduction histidine kinase/DNA-binding response OmpR family regulator